MEEALKSRVHDESSETAAKSCREAQEDLTAFLLESAANKQQFLNQTYFEESEKAGHLLASLANAQKGTTHISALCNAAGDLMTDTNDVLAIMSKYYAGLYTAKLRASPTEIL